jgi:hypothetical protein
MAFERGPYLTAAMFCERVLHERDGVLTAIRIIDRIMQTATGPEPPDEMPPVPLQLTALIAFKSGEARGSMNLALTPEDPSGRRLGTFTQGVLFEGEDRGVNLVMAVNFVAELAGLYWFDLALDHEPVTRIPLRVVYTTTRQPGPQP